LIKTRIYSDRFFLTETNELESLGHEARKARRHFETVRSDERDFAILVCGYTVAWRHYVEVHNIKSFAHAVQQVGVPISFGTQNRTVPNRVAHPEEGCSIGMFEKTTIG
jgi:hypothetical protein